jgi:hypothetical protein
VALSSAAVSNRTSGRLLRGSRVRYRPTAISSPTFMGDYAAPTFRQGFNGDYDGEAAGSAA